MNDNTRLGKELQELEKTDPEVRAAARRLDETVDQIVYRARTGVERTRFHKSTEDRPVQPYS